MRFIDLFAGLGGFHKALHELGHDCVFASELDTNLRQLYKQNWNIEAHGDIKKIVEKEIEIIPEHDILCAGFPCQPFSKAGKQLGRIDDRGNLFDEIIKILDFRKPTYFILENVPFIAKHDNEETWSVMKTELENLGYEVNHEVYSPQDFGIPQHRQRIFIVGSLNGLEHFSFKTIDNKKVDSIKIEKYIDKNSKTAKALPQVNIDCLNIWQEFLENIPKEIKIPGFPIWSMEFGADYPFEDNYPEKMTVRELSKYKGNFGISLEGMSRKEIRANLPSYARVTKKFPEWKKRYIRENRKFYEENKKHIENVVKKISVLPSQSWQKLEWNVGDSERNIYNYFLQFRASGIRIKLPNFFPSLVCTNTQKPIIGWEKRYISQKEALKLQSLEGLKLPDNDNAAFKALGNAVNSSIVQLIATELIQEPQIPKILNGRKKELKINGSQPLKNVEV
ncbi:DNA (cytosine-5-)-methyltransferase [Flavobacteriaceae bacterium XHP0103]|uniref:DNA cytosine methyltransferase n=1 Tax=Marixanthotalea marina TaxID=2844359 RepID=UPI002989E6BC|nr:DNA (cytosine-5-)-methyltransferase [Marixanthotalea marina]MBU3823153.1 DNA (cytosine-5-)-methyltransferase [Marixanthotalea marina]